MELADVAVGLVAVVTGAASLIRQGQRKRSILRLAIIFSVESLNLLAAALLALLRAKLLIISPLATIIILALAEWGVAALDLRAAIRSEGPGPRG